MTGRLFRPLHELGWKRDNHPIVSVLDDCPTRVPTPSPEGRRGRFHAQGERASVV